MYESKENKVKLQKYRVIHDNNDSALCMDVRVLNGHNDLLSLGVMQLRALQRWFPAFGPFA